MDTSVDRAIYLMQEGAQKEKGTWLSSMWGGNTRFTDAADCYTRAGNIFKVQKDFKRAGGAYEKSGEAHLKAGSGYPSAQSYILAAQSYQSDITDLNSTDEAIKCFEKALKYYTTEGKFSNAGKYKKEVAELYEKNGKMEKAMATYSTAAEYYENDNSVSGTNQCTLKVAHIAAELGKYEKAIESFEQVADRSKDNNLLKWSCREYYFKALICHLASGDRIGTRQALIKYKDSDVTFQNQIECRLIEQILDALEASDPEAIRVACNEYNEVSPLDPWKISLLFKVKKSITDPAPANFQ
eukprot:TRINITY_DN1033_c0_g1_i1.p1 TRINITY_DN1033_c0_g1~~TRINITY_DN1033_c0_g1_i1.p1  ORF type:complete len:298 (-),score=79.88 TRINITY_DN1033_c0_g1_i1:84-977(-)